MDNKEIIEKMTKVCICKSVSKLTIKKAIETHKCKTVEEVWKHTNTGNGSCEGRRCGSKIQEILDEML